MDIRRAALIYDTRPRPETTGHDCQRAFSGLADVVHFLPDEADRIPRTGFDLYVMIDDGLRYSLPQDLRPSAWWVIDTHMDPDWAGQNGRAFDWLFAAQRDGTERLRQAGLAAQWLPLAHDPGIHRPHPLDKRWDIGFLGAISPGPRQDLLSLLHQNFQNAFFGQAYFEEYARVLSQSRIGFNRSIRNDVNMRVFETVSCGTLLLTNDLKDNGQEELFVSEKHIVTYRTPEELLDKARFYLGHAELREKIAQAGYAQAKAHHTYRHRMEWLLRTVEAGTAVSVAPGYDPNTQNSIVA